MDMRSASDQGASCSTHKKARKTHDQETPDTSSKSACDPSVHKSEYIDQRDQKEHRKITTIDIPVPESFPPLDNLNEIKYVDHKGKAYLFKKYTTGSTTGDSELATESYSQDLNDLKETFVTFTDEQRTFIMHIYFMYKNHYDINETDADSPKIILFGPAGTGKSTIIKFLGKLITWEENKTSDSTQSLKVSKCAFTGDSAANIEGLTFHDMFSIRVGRDNITNLNDNQLASKREQLKDCVIFIFDDISVIDECLMDDVDSRLKEIFNNTRLYGNRFVLLVGDLHQINPLDNWERFYPWLDNWTCCEFYELTKILRQQDDKFINALNNLRHFKMRDEDIELFNSRNVKNLKESHIDHILASVQHMFFLHKHAIQHNVKKIEQSNEKKVTVNSFYRLRKREFESSKLDVKVGIRYKITYKVDVDDGLVNGATGVVQGFGYDKDDCVNIIWMLFNSNRIGRKARLEYIKTNGKLGFEHCVPIKKITDPNVSETIKNRFPLVAAEAVTVYRSLGQTFHEGICVNITDDPSDELREGRQVQYTALSRVRRLEDLYIKGNLTFQKVEDRIYQIDENELNRMRNENKLKIAYETFEDITGDVIVYLNTESTFNDHYQFIASDKWYSNASLLIFTETNTIKSDVIEINNFEMAFRLDNRTVLRSGGGLICYKKVKKSLYVVSSLIDENKMYLTLLLYDNFVYIITGVKGEDEENFKRALTTFIKDYVENRRCLLMIGNLNTKNIDFIRFLKFKPQLICDIADNVDVNDVMFTRNLKIKNRGFYQYIPSPHRPIYAILPINEFVQNVDQK